MDIIDCDSGMYSPSCKKLSMMIIPGFRRRKPAHEGRARRRAHAEAHALTLPKPHPSDEPARDPETSERRSRNAVEIVCGKDSGAGGEAEGLQDAQVEVRRHCRLDELESQSRAARV